MQPQNTFWPSFYPINRNKAEFIGLVIVEIIFLILAYTIFATPFLIIILATIFLIMVIWSVTLPPKWANICLKRIVFYLLFISSIYIISILILDVFGFHVTDDNTARYMLSALIQSEAAIIAIVISLTLIAIQQVSSSYSPKIIDIFKQNPDFWIILCLYVGTIIYQTWVLKQIQDDGAGIKLQHIYASSMETHYNFSFSLSIIALLSLIPYMWNTIEMMKPSTIILILSDRTTKEDFTEKKIPFQSIDSIITKSLMNYDYETLSMGLDSVLDQVDRLMKDKNLSDADRSIIIFKTRQYIEKFLNVAISKNDDEAGRLTLESIKQLIEISLDHSLIDQVTISIARIKDFGKLGIDAKLIATLYQSILLLSTTCSNLKELNKSHDGNQEDFVKSSKMAERMCRDLIKKSRDAGLNEEMNLLEPIVDSCCS
ncbi:hypothetical protein J2755_001464 [Methanohalophilus levihalophilus]|uniref:DUF2254 family protein n=1 Tax=Methanohalophilus levihalophilus TaxID=1431282 RepID=UPI001AEAD44A|nr:hypothetical protein [Methanohalophilus levihalophilus]